MTLIKPNWAKLLNCSYCFFRIGSRCRVSKSHATCVYISDNRADDVVSTANFVPPTRCGEFWLIMESISSAHTQVNDCSQNCIKKDDSSFSIVWFIQMNDNEWVKILIPLCLKVYLSAVRTSFIRFSADIESASEGENEPQNYIEPQSDDATVVSKKDRKKNLRK